ncbi:MAG: NUDIX hydrolase [Caldisericia bacterium]
MEKKISEEIIFKGNLIKVILRKVTVNNHKESYREIVYHPGAVGIIPVTKENKLMLVKQYRSPFEDYLIEIPAGKLKENEDPLGCAKRELLEETGYSGEMEKIGVFSTSPGFSNELIHIFLCKNAEYKTDNYKHFGEIENLILLSIDEALNLLLNGEIKDLKTAFSIIYINEKFRSF